MRGLRLGPVLGPGGLATATAIAVAVVVTVAGCSCVSGRPRSIQPSSGHLRSSFVEGGTFGWVSGERGCGWTRCGLVLGNVRSCWSRSGWDGRPCCGTQVGGWLDQRYRTDVEIGRVLAAEESMLDARLRFSGGRCGCCCCWP